MPAETGTTGDQRSDPEYQTQTLQLADGTMATFGPPGSPICIQYPSLPGPWQYHVDVVPLGGVLGIAHLCIKQKPSTPSGLETPITGRSLRTVPVQRFMQGARQAHLRQLQESAEHAEIVPPPTGSRSWPDEHFMQVAQEYWQAQADGRPTRQAISEQWSVSKVTASRWLRRARELGYLDADHARQPRRLEPDPEADHEDSARLLEAMIFRKILANLATTAESPLREKAQALSDAIHEAHGEQPPPLPPHLRGKVDRVILDNRT
jgi:hypothetical protein